MAERTPRAIFLPSVGALIVTLLIVGWLADKSNWTARNIWLGMVFGFWLIAPPLWAMWEWYTFEGNQVERENLKQGQELARNLWVAVSVVLGLLLGFKAL